MTVEDAKEVTEVVKGKLKENGDVYSEHILAYVSYLEAQIEKMKCCGNCKHWIESLDYGGEPVLLCELGGCDEIYKCGKWELAE